MKTLMADCETGGLDPHSHSLLSWGMLVGDLETGEILETYEAKVKLPSIDDYVASPKALEVNGLNVQDCFKNGVPPEEIRDKMLDMYLSHGCSKIGGHNWPFDREFACVHLFDGMSRAEFDNTFTYHVIDTLPFLRLIEGHKNLSKGVRLEHVAKTLGIKANDYAKEAGHHDALYDIVVTFRLAHTIRKACMDVDFKKCMS